MKKILVTSLIGLVASSASAQIRLSLEEALARCRQNNLSVQQARLEAGAARYQVRQFLSTGLPQVNATGNYYYNVKPQQFILPGEFFGQPGTFQRVDASPPFQASLGLSATLRLIDGSYIYGLQATRLYKDITEAQAQQIEADLQRQVRETYAQLVFVRENLKILEEDVADAQKLKNEIEAYVKQGFREYLDARTVQFATDTLNLTRERLKTQCYALELSLKQLLNLSLDELLEPTETLEQLTAHLNHTEILGETLPVTELNAPELKILSLSVKGRSLNEKVELARAFPSLSTFFNHGYAGFNNDKSRPILLAPGSQYFPSGTTWGFSLSVPIFSSLYRHSSLRQAQIMTQKARLQAQDVSRLLEVRLRLVKAQYRLALQSLNQAESNLTLQEEIQAINRAKYREGLLSSFELLQTDAQYRAARRALSAARLQLLLLRAQYLYLTGKL
jgi:outer membrane protein TolC